MSSFKCPKCGNEQEAVRGMPPVKCEKCNARSPGWTKVAAGSGSPTQTPPLATPPKKAGGTSIQAPTSVGGMPNPSKASPKPVTPKSPSFLKANPSAGSTHVTATKQPTPPMKAFNVAPPAAKPPISPPPVTTPTRPAVATPPVVKSVPPVVAESTPVPILVKEPSPIITSLAPTTATPVSRVEPEVQRGSDRVAWTFPESVQTSAKPQRNCPAVDQAGRVYFAIADKVFAFDNNEGDFQYVWDYETGGRILGSPVVGSDGSIRIHSEDGHLHIMSKDKKRVGTPVQVGEPLGWATPLVDSQNTTWICGYHGGLSKVEAIGDAAPTLYFRGKQRFDCTGLIHGGLLYVGAENACVYAIPLGESRGQNVWNHLNEEGRTGWFINSSLALASGPTIVVASRDDRLYGFQLDGKERWSVEPNGQMLGSPIVDADDSVYVGLSVSEGREKPRGALVRIDGMSHKVRWRFETDSPVESTPVLGDDGTVYFGDNDGFIHAVDRDGKQVWTKQVAAGVRSSGTILAGGRVVFGLENGQFVALKCESQSLRAGAWAKYLGNASQTGVPMP